MSSPMLTPEAIRAVCDETVHPGYRGSAAPLPGRMRVAEGLIRRFLQDQDRDALADVVSRALGAQEGVHRAASRAVVDALLDGTG